MSTTIRIQGHYEQKLRIFGKTLSHNKGTFDITREVSGTAWSQSHGIVGITESIQDGKATVSLSALGHSVPLIKKGVVGHNKFKIEIDRANKVEGTIVVSNEDSGEIAEGGSVPDPEPDTD